MKYIIMCGGTYDKFKQPKQFIEILGERLIDRTIRLLKENGIEDIAISTNNEDFKSCGVPLIKNKDNNYVNDKNSLWGKQGYWLDAFCPYCGKCVYLYGDVFYTDNAIKIIKKTVETETKKNILFGSAIALNKLHKNWGEPFAYLVNDMPIFRVGINAVKKLQDEGKLKREAITWELYRYLNGLDVNVHSVLEETFIAIDDATNDIDNEKEIQMMLKKLEGYNGK